VSQRGINAPLYNHDIGAPEVLVAPEFLSPLSGLLKPSALLMPTGFVLWWILAVSGKRTVHVFQKERDSNE
jgi:hypothetical protein